MRREEREEREEREGGRRGRRVHLLFFFLPCLLSSFSPYLTPYVNCLHALTLSLGHIGTYIHVYVYIYVHVPCTFVNVHLYVKTYKHVLYMYIHVYVKVCVYSDFTASSATGGNRY